MPAGGRDVHEGALQSGDLGRQHVQHPGPGRGEDEPGDGADEGREEQGGHDAALHEAPGGQVGARDQPRQHHAGTGRKRGHDQCDGERRDHRLGRRPGGIDGGEVARGEPGAGIGEAAREHAAQEHEADREQDQDGEQGEDRARQGHAARPPAGRRRGDGREAHAVSPSGLPGSGRCRSIRR